MAHNEEGRSRIIVDEDWKSQVERERQALAKEQAAPAGPDPALGPMPPASLSVLIMSLATQALVALGHIGQPGMDETTVRLDEARHLIDLLEVVQNKTEGNRTAEETAALDDVLHQLRLAYLSCSDLTTSSTR